MILMPQVRLRRRSLGLLSISTVFGAARRALAEDEAPQLTIDQPEPAAEPVLPTPDTTARPESSAARVLTLTDEERILLEQNQRIKVLNRAPSDFPAFIRKGYSVQVLADGYKYDDNGLIYKDYLEGTGDTPNDGQQVIFEYVAYNELGGTIDSSERKARKCLPCCLSRAPCLTRPTPPLSALQGRPAETRLGINGLIPGFEAGLKTMRVGGRRRLIVPPELGPPVGPSTFFSAKQFEVFDIELISIKSCERKASLGGILSNVTCE